MKDVYSYIITICLTALIIIIVGLTLIAPMADPLIYAVQPFTLDRLRYTTQDQMIVHSYRCNNEGKPLVVQTKELYFYNLETGKRYDMPPSTGPIQAGCSWQEARVVSGWHPDMPSGRYVKKGVTVAHGRWRTIEVPWITEQFDYVKT